MKTKLSRFWINCPSTSQDDHEYHGRNVLVSDDEYEDNEKYVNVYLTDGPMSSMRIAKLSLSRGWK